MSLFKTLFSDKTKYRDMSQIEGHHQNIEFVQMQWESVQNALLGNGFRKQDIKHIRKCIKGILSPK